MELGIEGKVALVLGASRGIGRAVATQLAGEGARVAVAGRSVERLAQLAGEIEALAFEHDNAQVDHAPTLIAAVAKALGPIEILVTNTGGPPASADPLANTPDQWQQAYETLVRAPLELIRAALPGMRDHRFGRIVNIASSAVREPLPGMMLSNSHRAATLAAFKTLARDVAADGVTVNSVLPGRIATERIYDLAGGREQAEAAARTEIPVARLGAPEELAAAVTFLCSARASYITGVALLVDGGLTRLV
ncbi:MAG: SDR family oxidoreductase [Solirubrobacteraceae bacterium]|jgi:3-oxoacyl-[acyl-carrier protein] reductase